MDQQESRMECESQQQEMTTSQLQQSVKPKEVTTQQLEDWADLIRNDIRIQDYKNGWFGKHHRCAVGGDIQAWIMEHVETNDQKAKQICQKMLEKEIIQNIEGKQLFNTNELYRMYMDRDDVADNLTRKWKGEARNALLVSTQLVAKIGEVYQEAFIEEDGEKKIDVEQALKSSQFRGYLIACCELEKVNLIELSIK